MSINPNDIIPVSDLPRTPAGPSDDLLGVQGGRAFRFPRDSIPLSAGDEARLIELQASQQADYARVSDVVARVALVEVSQSAGMIGYPTKAVMDGDLDRPPGTLGLVTGDPVAANNGTYRKGGAIGAGGWTKAVDRVSDLEASAAKAEVLTSQIERAGTVNLFTTAGASAGKSVSTADGSLFDKSGWSATDFIPVDPDTPYRRTTQDAYAQYDANKLFIAGASTVNSFATAPNARYVRLGFANSTGATEVLARSSQFPAGYVPYVQKPKLAAVSLPRADVGAAMKGPTGALRDDVPVDPRSATFLKRASVNLFDKSRVTSGLRLSTTLVPDFDTTNNITEYIKVKPSTQYRISEGSFTHEYDANFNIIHTHGVGITNWTTKAGTAWMRTTVRNVRLNDLMLVEGASLPASYVPFDVYVLGPQILGASGGRFSGARWNAMGDSITAAAGSYVDSVPAHLGLSLGRNYGIGGTAIAVRAAPWDSNAMCVRYSEMDEAAELVTVAGGTNDFGTSVALGNMGSSAINTFYGALHALCQGLGNRYPTATIVFFTPLPRRRMNEPNGQNLLLKDYVEAIKEVCSYYGIPVVDLYRLTQFRPWNAANAAALMPDELHPNAAGYQMLSAIIAQQLRAL